MENRPQGRTKNITGEGKETGKRGSGLGTGPVGKTASKNRPKSILKSVLNQEKK